MSFRSNRHTFKVCIERDRINIVAALAFRHVLSKTHLPQLHTNSGHIYVINARCNIRENSTHILLVTVTRGVKYYSKNAR